jgi:hypothetical protein
LDLKLRFARVLINPHHGIPIIGVHVYLVLLIRRLINIVKMFTFKEPLS